MKALAARIDFAEIVGAYVNRACSVIQAPGSNGLVAPHESVVPSHTTLEHGILRPVHHIHRHGVQHLVAYYAAGERFR